ncbi:MAG: hypothetical protein KUG77_21755 [Nannocystaceae bacterium]|nr:hypothetical protein [Nannocystaceae bacterium]
MSILGRLGLLTGLLLGLGSGCQTCDLSASASVALEVVDAADGSHIFEPRVTFTIDEGEPEIYEDDGRYGPTLILAFETEGRFEVTIEADGYATQMRTYDIREDEDGCHVDGELDRIELEPED